MIENFFEVFIKDNQMRSPSLLSGQKIRKANFEASNPKILLDYLIVIMIMKTESSQDCKIDFLSHAFNNFCTPPHLLNTAPYAFFSI